MSLAGSRPEDEFHADLLAYSAPDLTPARAREIEARIAEVSHQYEPVDLLPGRTYDVQSIVAPVFGPDGDVQLVLRICHLPAGAAASTVMSWIEELTAAARRVSTAESINRIHDEMARVE